MSAEPATLTALLLDPIVASDPMGPLVTYYDDASGERIECSAVTLANWAAKTANLLREELGGGPHSSVAVLLPAHWQTAAVLLGCWWVGAQVSLDGEGGADIALCTADRLAEADDVVGGVGEVAVCSLDPFGRPVDGLPVGVTDYATSVRVHGDAIAPEPRPGPALAGLAASQVLARAREVGRLQHLGGTDRVMSSAGWAGAEDLIAGPLAVFAAGASLVQVANPDARACERRRITEKVTRMWP